MNSVAAKRILEAALLCTMQPISIRDMRSMLGEAVGADTIRRLLLELQQEWEHRGLMLVQVATGWRFQSRPEMGAYLERLRPEKPPKYSRAVMETLAIIAYRQPVTRGDMEDIRGVTINSTIIKQLEDRGWIEVIGHREGPGRPALFATTRAFLDDLGLPSLQELPTLDAQDVSAALAELGQNNADVATSSPDEAPLGDSPVLPAGRGEPDLFPDTLPEPAHSQVRAGDLWADSQPQGADQSHHQAADGAHPAADAEANPTRFAVDSQAPQTVTPGPEGQIESQA